MKIDLNLFTVFEAIYTEGSLTRAAERLNLTQPAISHALSRLRDRLDDPLFVRQGHRMRPTPLAQNLLPNIQNALSQLNSALQQAHEFDPAAAEKTFKIAMRDIMEASFIPPIVDKLDKENLNIQLASVHMERKEMEAKLASGDIDFALDVVLPTPQNIRQLKLINDELVVIKRKGSSIDCADKTAYLNAKHIVVSLRATGPSLVDYALSSVGLNRKVGLRCQHYFAGCQVVSQGDMLLTMPKHYAQVLLNHFDNLELQPLPFETPNIDVYLYWHKSQDNNAANQWFRSFIKAELTHLSQ